MKYKLHDVVMLIGNFVYVERCNAAYLENINFEIFIEVDVRGNRRRVLDKQFFKKVKTKKLDLKKCMLNENFFQEVQKNKIVLTGGYILKRLPYRKFQRMEGLQFFQYQRKMSSESCVEPSAIKRYLIQNLDM